MSHFRVTVALPPDVAADRAVLYERLEAALAPFDENVEENEDADRARWDWWCVGGRWGGSWRLRVPIEYETLPTEEAAFGMMPDARVPGATDCARLCDIAPESIGTVWAYVDLDGQWHEKATMGWFGEHSLPEGADEVDEVQMEMAWRERYLTWITSLDARSWLISVDCHI